MNNKILLIFFSIFCISLISATYDLQDFYINEQMNLTGIKCLELNNSACEATVNCYLTVMNSTQDIVVNNQTMIAYSGGYRSYDLGLAPADSVEWSVNIFCDNGGSVSFIIFIENRTEAICPTGQVVSGRYANGSLICVTDVVGVGGGGGQITYIQMPGENSTITFFSFDIIKSDYWVINESTELVIKTKDTYGSTVDITSINITSNIKFDTTSLTRQGVGMYSTYITPREINGYANFTILVKQNAKTIEKSFITNISEITQFQKNLLVSQSFISSGTSKLGAIFKDTYFLIFLLGIFLILIVLVVIEIFKRSGSREATTSYPSFQ